MASNYYDLKAEALQDKIFDVLYESEDSEEKLNESQRFEDGHAQIHSPANYSSMEAADIDAMETILNPNSTKRISGVFETDDLQLIAAANVIGANAKNTILNLDSVSEGQNVVMSYENIMPDDSKIGHGFIYHNGTIREFESNCATVILKKNSLNDNAFNVQTVFAGVPGGPDTQIPHLKITDKDCTPIVKQTDYYKNASPVEKAYLEYISNPKNTKNGYLPFIKRDENYGDTLTLVRMNKDGSSFRAFITEEQMNVSLTDASHKKVPVPFVSGHPKKVLLTDKTMKTEFATKLPTFTKTIGSLHNRINQLDFEQKHPAVTEPAKKENISKNRELPSIEDSKTSFEIDKGV